MRRLNGSLLLLVAMCLFVFIPLYCQENPAQNRAMARRAALVDAQRILLEMIDGIYIDAETQVKDFITTNDSIKGELDGYVRAAEVVQENYEDDIYTVTMRVNAAKLRAILGHEFEYGAPHIEATGNGAAPTGMQRTPKPEELDIPAENWYEIIVKSEGYGAPPEDAGMSKAQRILNAERAAKMDAYRNLIEEIKGVNVTSETTIQDFITEDDTIETNIRAFVRGARQVSRRQLEDGTVVVTLEISLEPLKSIID